MSKKKESKKLSVYENLLKVQSERENIVASEEAEKAAKAEKRLEQTVEEISAAFDDYVKEYNKSNDVTFCFRYRPLADQLGGRPLLHEDELLSMLKKKYAEYKVTWANQQSFWACDMIHIML